MRPEPAGPGRGLPLDQPDHGVGQVGVGADQPFVGGGPLDRVLLVEQPLRGEGSDQVVRPVAAAADVLQQPGGGQFGQPAAGLLLVGGQQRRGRGRPETGPAGEREAAQQAAARLGLVVVAQREHPVDRVARPEHLDVVGQSGRAAVLGEPGGRDPQRDRQARGQLAQPLGLFGRRGVGTGRVGDLAEQFEGVVEVQRADRQVVHDRARQIRVERLGGGDQHQALGALRHQLPDLLGVGRVVQHDHHRHAGQVLLVLLGEAAHVLALVLPLRPLPEEELVAGRAEPVEQVQQRVPDRQRRGARAAQVDHARALELVLQLPCRAHREGAAATAGRAVQDHDRGAYGS